MNKIFIILLILWQIPQSLIGILYTKFIQIEQSEKYKDCRIFFLKNYKEFGISFGYRIFLSNDTRGKELLEHEYGHSIQSRLLGPLYLLIIAIPSVIRYFIYFKIKMSKTKTPEEKLNIRKKYYQGFPENWADRLGQRNTEC